jgi:hypothetical protein
LPHSGVYARFRGLCETHRYAERGLPPMGFARAQPILQELARKSSQSEARFASFNFPSSTIRGVGSTCGVRQLCLPPDRQKICSTITSGSAARTSLIKSRIAVRGARRAGRSCATQTAIGEQRIERGGFRAIVHAPHAAPRPRPTRRRASPATPAIPGRSSPRPP